MRLHPVGDLLAVLEKVGHVPLPPYIRRDNTTGRNGERYQTVFARRVPGSSAAPTAGICTLHPRNPRSCKAQEPPIAHVTLHVGLGTFQPLRTDTLEDVHLHKETFVIPPESHLKRWTRPNGSSPSAQQPSGPSRGSGLQRNGISSSTWASGSATPSAMLNDFHLPRSEPSGSGMGAFAGRELGSGGVPVRLISQKYRFRYSSLDGEIVCLSYRVKISKFVASHPLLTVIYCRRARRRLFGQLVLDPGALAMVIGMAAVILRCSPVPRFSIGKLAGSSSSPSAWAWESTACARAFLPNTSCPKRSTSASAWPISFHSRLLRRPSRARAGSGLRSAAPRCGSRRAACRYPPGGPPSRSRYLLPAAGLALVAFGLFAVRYAVTGSLSLEPALLKMAYDSFFGPPPQLAKNQAKRLNMAQDPFDPGNPDAQSTATDQQPEDLLELPGFQRYDESPGRRQRQAGRRQRRRQEGGDADKQGKEKGDDKDGKQSDERFKDGKDPPNKSRKAGVRTNRAIPAIAAFSTKSRTLWPTC